MKLRKKKELQVQEARAKFFEAVQGRAIVSVPALARKKPFLMIAIALVLGCLAARHYTNKGNQSLFPERLLKKLLK